MSAGSSHGVDTALLARGRVRLERSGACLTIWLDAPEVRNAQLPETWQALAAVGAHAIEIADDDAPEGVRVVIVRGSGSSFSSGLDTAAFDPGPDGLLRALAHQPAAVLDRTIETFQHGLSWLADPRFISIAAVQGHAVGAGFQLALACDLIIAAEDAQFCMAEVTRGLVPDLGGTGRLVRAVGQQRALEMCATGRRVGAGEAVRIGLALAAVPVDDLGATVDDLAAALTAADVEAVRAVTRLILGSHGRSDVEQRAAERAEQSARLRALTRGRGQEPAN